MIERQILVCYFRLPPVLRPSGCQLRHRFIGSMAPKRKPAANVESEFIAPEPKAKKPKPKKLTEPVTDEQGWTAHPPSLIYKRDLLPSWPAEQLQCHIPKFEVHHLYDAHRLDPHSMCCRIKKPAAAGKKIAAFDMVRACRQPWPPPAMPVKQRPCSCSGLNPVSPPVDNQSGHRYRRRDFAAPY